MFDRTVISFKIYADQKLLAAEMIAGIRELFNLPADRTTIEGDFHYRSTETPNVPVEAR